MVSMDGLFGLPRKKSAGKSHRGPLHGDLYFKDQHAVDEYVASATSAKMKDKVTSIYYGIVKVWELTPPSGLWNFQKSKIHFKSM